MNYVQSTMSRSCSRHILVCSARAVRKVDLDLARDRLNLITSAWPAVTLQIDFRAYHAKSRTFAFC